MHQEHSSCTEKIFINPGAESRTASQSFGHQICKMTKRYADVVRNFCRLSHFNIHGLWKGSGTHAASATTCPPLLVEFNLLVHIGMVPRILWSWRLLNKHLFEFYLSMAVRRTTLKVSCPFCLPAWFTILIGCLVCLRRTQAIPLENFSFSLAPSYRN